MNSSELASSPKLSTASPSASVAALLEHMIKLIADKPEAVSLYADWSADRCVFQVSCDETDTAKLIGRKGTTARMFRQLLVTLSGKFKLRMEIQFPDHKKSCIHCGCTEDEACYHELSGTCSWVQMFRRPVCSNDDCMRAELRYLHAAGLPRPMTIVSYFEQMDGKPFEYTEMEVAK